MPAGAAQSGPLRDAAASGESDGGDSAALAASDTPTRSQKPARASVAGASQSAAAPAANQGASWPTRRKRSQLVDLPVQELDHVRGDLARIGLLSLGMVIVLVALTVVLR